MNTGIPDQVGMISDLAREISVNYNPSVKYIFDKEAIV